MHLSCSSCCNDFKIALHSRRKRSCFCLGMANTIHAYLRQVLSSHAPRNLCGDRRASVALVLRGCGPLFSETSEASALTTASQSSWLELLFIQRAARDDDPWSGHIAFPGGRRCSEDADDMATAIRETREELSIALDDTSQYAALGALHQHPVTKNGTEEQGGVLCAYVFFQLQSVTPYQPVPDEREVAAALWVPLHRLERTNATRSVCICPVPTDKLSAFGRRIPKGLFYALGMANVRLPAVDVYATATEVIYAAGDAALEVPTNVLWGMTLRTVGDLVEAFGGERVDRPRFVFDHPLWSALGHFIFSARKLFQRIMFWRKPKRKLLLISHPKSVV